MKRVVIANFYPIWPPVGGGQRRIFFLARELSKAFDVEIVAPDWSGDNKTTTFGPHLRETRVGVERRFRTLEQKVSAEAPMTADIAYALHWEACTLYNEVLRRRLASADIAVTTHPYSTYPLLSCLSDRDLPIVFDSQNVELRQKKFVLEKSPRLFDAVREVEATALSASRQVIACSEKDAADFVAEYGVDASRITIIENGVDALGVPVVPDNELAALRGRLGLNARLSAVFGASFHQPNFRAAERIVETAAALPGMQFILLGTVCNHQALKGPLPQNVVSMGEVDENTKWMAFRLADIGLNPMEQGSGTNIKMFEYAAAGLAVLSSPFGARGIGLEPGREFIVCEIDDMIDKLGELTVADRQWLEAMGDRARKQVTRTADWSVIGRRYIQCFSDLVV